MLKETLLLFLLIVPSIFAQQTADTTFIPHNSHVSFAGDNRPVVYIDQAHYNFHTLDGQYQAFARVLESDGYKVKSNTCSFNLDSLAGANILVIANALNEVNTQDPALPNYPAFTRQENLALYQWVKDGGSLLLIADHMPFPAAAHDLAALFGFQFCNGFAIDTTNQEVTLFKRSDKTLVQHPIIHGLKNSERIDSVRSFTGQAFLAPFTADPLMVFAAPTVSFMPDSIFDFGSHVPRIPADHWCQGATLEFHKGRIAVFGEAAMFTAQYIGEYNMWIGLKTEGAEQNEQFLLNVMHWLSFLL